MKQLHWKKHKPKRSAIAEALIDGRVLILPASTIYGISCRYDDTGALSRIYRIKRRKTGMPFIVLISDTVQLEMLAKDIYFFIGPHRLRSLLKERG